MEKMIAYCGLVCTECEAYLATQANDLAKLEELAERARREYGSADATVEGWLCDGCLSTSERKCRYCAVCAIRACGEERGLANCAHCADYATCDKLDGFISGIPQARALLESIRAGLSATD